MKIPTKTLASLMVVTAVAAAVPGITRKGNRRRYESQFDRLLQRHDRKGELRSSVLGISPEEFRLQSRGISMTELAKKYGFPTERSFRLALLGRIKDELHGRGWSDKRMERHMMLRSERIGS
jgi:hypothetical protein